MSIISNLRISRPYRSILSAFLMLFVVITTIGAVSVKHAWASNNYIDNISFSYDTDGKILFHFHVKTSFNSWCWSKSQYSCFFWAGQGFPNDLGQTNISYWERSGDYWYNGDIYWSPIFQPGVCPDDTYDETSYCPVFEAGHNYTTFIGQGDQPIAATGYFRNGFDNPDTTKIPSRTTWADNEDYNWAVPFPTLTITWPPDNSEIAESFYIEGSWTQPQPYIYHWLIAFINPVGQGYTDTRGQTISINGEGVATGTMSIWIDGLPAGYYDFDIWMLDTENNYIQFPGWHINNIHIVQDLPQTLPPYQEQPPTTMPPVYQTLDCAIYYDENSTYATSTGLYSGVCGTFSPVLLSIGQNLTDFATRFSQSNASSTGNQLGASIVIVRSYIQNINEFFYGFPLSQILLLYLIALVVVIVLRLVKGLINLFKI